MDDVTNQLVGDLTYLSSLSSRAGFAMLFSCSHSPTKRNPTTLFREQYPTVHKCLAEDICPKCCLPDETATSETEAADTEANSAE